jgi:hypothetical protein
MGERRILTTIGATLICCAGCGDEGQVGVLQQAGTSQAYFQVEWLPKHAVCKKDAAGALSCIGADDSQAITPQSVSGAAKVTQTSDKVDPRLQVDVVLPLDDGRVFHLELDLPDGDDDGATSPPKVAYSESDPGGAQTFTSAGAAGRLQRMRSGCSCRDLVLDLLVIDGGPDQLVGTADDEHRHLRLGQLDFGSACLAPKLFAVTPSTKLSLDLLSCGDAGSSTGPYPGYGRTDAGRDGSSYTPPSGGGSGGGSGYRLPDPSSGGCECEGSGDYGYDDTGGCEGDTSDGCEGDSGGCEGDSGGCEGDTGGCEGDTGGGGCEGDMGGGGGCEGDLGGGADCSGGGGGADCRLCPRGGRRLRINTLPVLLLLLLGVYGVRRLHRRR